MVARAALGLAAALTLGFAATLLLLAFALLDETLLLELLRTTCLRAFAHRPVPIHGAIGAELRRHHHRAVGVVGHGERGGVGKVGAHVGDHLRRTLGSGVVDAIREQDDEHLTLGIDPERRAGKARCARMHLRRGIDRSFRNRRRCPSRGRAFQRRAW